MTDSSAPQSFDPRNWKRTVVPADGSIAANARASTPAASAPAGPAATRGLGVQPVAFLGSAALLAGAALWAHWSRPAEMPVAPPVAGVAPPTTPDAPRNERRMLVLSGARDLEGALVASGVDPASAKAVATMAVPDLKPGEIRAAMTLSSRAGGSDLVRLEVSSADSSGVIVERKDGKFAASAVAADLTSQVVVRRGTMDADSFYSSAVTAGVPNGLISDFAAALAFDFDFQREVKKGDAFEATFEQRVDRDGRPVGPAKLLYAALSTQTKAAAVYRFAPDGGEAGWFDSDGKSIKRALMRTPVDAARVSSNFGFRIHPVLGYAKLHEGTDFAAPTGTPIFASGDGVVEWAAMKGPNGNLTILRHDNGWLTYYLHQSMFMPGIEPGVRVSQGQEIGKVGTTGRSTGPHLHYALKIDGKFVDAMSIQTEAAPPLAGAPLIAFKKERDRIDVSRARSTQS